MQAASSSTKNASFAPIAGANAKADASPQRQGSGDVSSDEEEDAVSFAGDNPT